MTKSEQISKTLLETKQRRLTQVCKTFELKADKSHLSKSTIDQIEQLFREGRWTYNYLLSLIDRDGIYKLKLHEINTKDIKTVIVKRKDIFEEEELHRLSSQMKQSIQTKMGNSLKALHALKVKGKKVGSLKYKSDRYFNCIPLKQFNNTFRILNDKYISIQSVKGKIKVNGLKQLTKHVEIANANLIRKADDYFIKITCYIDKEKVEKVEKMALSVGIDFGVTHPLTLSDEVYVDYEIPVSDRTKKEQKKLKHKEKGSKNYKENVKRIQRAYEKSNNQKKDIQCKIVHGLDKVYEHVIIQDESLKFWQSKHGKKMQRKHYVR